MARGGAALTLLFVSISASTSNPGSRNCSTHWFRQPLDHFSFSPPPPPSTGFWLQRYLVHDSFFNPRNGTIFFYTGNEGDVTLYADHCGLMWENAAQFNALLIFAEHRFYGLSQPFPGANATQHYGYLSSQLALADYANLLREVLPALGAAASPVVAFGGSYGGVLAATFRASYPGSVDGAIASSAPLRAFPGQEPPWDSALYYQVPTRDASVEGGSAAACAPNVRAAFPLILAAGATPAGRAELGAAFRTCAPLNVSDDAVALAFWVRAAWDTLAMGSYPYPSNYLTGGGKVLLPAYPVRVACGALAAPLTGVPLLEGVREAIAVLYNASRDLPCFDVDVNPYTHPAAPYDGIWDWQQCTEMQPDSQWFSSTGVSDMFFFAERNLTFLEEHCRAAWGVAPAWTWISARYNLPSFRGASNIVFSNGLMDPWSGGSLQHSPAPERDLVVLNISEAGHHLDLFFSDPLDPVSVRQARAVEVAYIAKWVQQARAAR